MFVFALDALCLYQIGISHRTFIAAVIIFNSFRYFLCACTFKSTFRPLIPRILTQAELPTRTFQAVTVLLSCQSETYALISLHVLMYSCAQLLLFTEAFQHYFKMKK